MVTSVTLAPEIQQRLDRIASRTGRTKAIYLRKIIERGIDDVEDLYLAQKVLEVVRTGEETTDSLDNVEKRLGLTD